MKPTIDQTAFGSITIEGTTFEHDVLIHLNGEIEKRKKKLSKAIYGTSHVLSLDEAKFVYEKGTKRLIIGSGQPGRYLAHTQSHRSLEQSQWFSDRLVPRHLLNGCRGRLWSLTNYTGHP